MPGRVLKAMKDAGTVNPVFLLDEVDKIGSDFRGDPAAALLEVLDPEQNSGFSDHYFDVAYDLSRVMFIATANLLDTVPPALRDRLEVIQLPGYTEDEKLEIARRFLVPRQIEANGLTADQRPSTKGDGRTANQAPAVRFSDAALRRLIRDYTYEAGVRGLEREIGAVCRKLARRAAERRPLPRLITPAMVERFLGSQPRAHGVAEEHDEVGVATGLSWTAGGGDVMAIEVSTMKGRGQLALTGQLGEVMRESAQAALTFARANAEALGIKAKRFETNDVHIHVPAGGVPKDGPSAGITLATALVSAFTGRAVRRDVAMTGEITLRGRVLPVGGVKEKVLGAHRAGIATVILPRRNERDLAEVPANVKRRMRFVYVDRMDEVLEAALCPLGAALTEQAE